MRKSNIKSADYLELLSDIFGELRQVGPTLRAWHQQVTAAEVPVVSPIVTPLAEADDDEDEDE